MRSAPVVHLAALAVVTAATAQAGTVIGRVELTEKSGRKATDLSDVVVYVEGVRVKPRPATATVVMKGKAFLPRMVVVPVGVLYARLIAAGVLP